MSATAEAFPSPDYRSAAALLGGARILRHRLGNLLDVHEMLLEGLPGEALNHLVSTLRSVQKTASLEKAVGMSLRTFQRRQDHPSKPLSQEQSSRTWKFAEILSRAIAVLGSQDAAEAWLETPATALDRRMPIDLLATPAGTTLVEDLLGRMEHGVYT